MLERIHLNKEVITSTTIVPFRINFRTMLTRALMRVTCCKKVYEAGRLLPSIRPGLNCPTLPNSNFSAAALLSSDSRNVLCLPAYSHTGLAPLQHRIICTNQLSKRLCSSATPPPTPQQLRELKVEKMQLSYTCKVPPAPILCTASNISQRN